MAVGVLVSVGVGVTVSTSTVGVGVADAVLVGVAVPVGVCVGVAVGSGVHVGVCVGVGVRVGVWVGVGVTVGVGVCVGVGVGVAVGPPGVQVGVGVGVCVGVGVTVGVGVPVGVSVAVGVRVGVGVLLGVGVRVGVRVTVGVAVGVPTPPTGTALASTQTICSVGVTAPVCSSLRNPPPASALEKYTVGMVWLNTCQVPAAVRVIVVEAVPVDDTGHVTVICSPAAAVSFATHTCSGTLVAVTPAISSVLEMLNLSVSVMVPVCREYGLVV